MLVVYPRTDNNFVVAPFWIIDFARLTRHCDRDSVLMGYGRLAWCLLMDFAKCKSL